MKRTLFLSAAAVTIVGVTLLGATSAFAQSTNGQDTLVQKIADTFKLNKTDVQKVFDQHRFEHMVQMQARLEEKLTQAVKDGKITETQKQAILAKLKELQSQKQTKMQGFGDMTPEQRKAAMQQQKIDLENWAKAQGLDVTKLKSLMGGFGHKGMGRGFVK